MHSQNQQKAIDLIKQAITFHQQGDLMKAKPLYQSALDLSPNNFDGLQLMGLLHGQIEHYDASLKYFEKAFALKQDMPALLSNYALLLNKMGKYEEALAMSDRLMGLKEVNPNGLFNRAIILRNLEKFEEAHHYIKQALTYAPTDIKIQIEYGLALDGLGQKDAAIRHFNQIIKNHPNLESGYSNRAIIYERHGFYHHAIKDYETSLKLNPDQALTRFNYSLLLILIGKYDLGWQYYESRWDSVALSQDYTIVEIRKQLTAPEWDGKQSLFGKSIIVYSEQGLGDVLHFLRYLPILKASGAKIRFLPRKSHKPIVPLISEYAGIDEILDIDKPFQVPDTHCGLLSLAHYLKADAGQFPKAVAAKINANRLDDWRLRLGLKRAKLRIGFVMQGSGNIKGRDTSLEEWKPLFNVFDIEWILLQKNINKDDLEQNQSHGYFKFFGDEIRDFADTAAIISLCDLVISVDTAVAHLAGMQGQSHYEQSGNNEFLHLLLPHLPSFRWGLKTKNTAWYHCARLWRQNRQGEWSAVINQLKFYLADRIKHE